MAVYLGAIDDLGEWISLGAIVCYLGHTSFEQIADHNANLSIGSLVVNPRYPDEPDDHRIVTLRHALRINDLQVNEFMYALKPIVLNADQVREQIMSAHPE
jgi:hypothetical protein